MTTTVRLNEQVRDKFQQFKNERGMTYDGAIMRLLEIEDMVSIEAKVSPDQTHDTESPNNTEDYTPIPEPDSWYREGVDGAIEFVTTILASQLADAGQYRPTVSSTIRDLYGQMDIEPQVAYRTADSTVPTVDDLIESVEERIENPAEHTMTNAESEREHLAKQSMHIGQALSVYQLAVGESDIPLESRSTPTITVPPDRMYRGEQQDGENIVTSGGTKLDPRPDLNSGGHSFSWGYSGTGPRVLATAILADAYPDRYASARSQDLYNNYTSRLPVGKSWEIRAEELDQHITTS